MIIKCFYYIPDAVGNVYLLVFTICYILHISFCFCHIPIFWDCLQKFEATHVFSCTLFSAIFPIMKLQLIPLQCWIGETPTGEEDTTESLCKVSYSSLFLIAVQSYATKVLTMASIYKRSLWLCYIDATLNQNSIIFTLKYTNIINSWENQQTNVFASQ